MRDEGHLPHLSARLGELTRTNSEAILGARTFRRGRRLHQGRGHHVVVPPRRPHPHRARPLRQGQQRHGHADHRARRRRRQARGRSPGCRGDPPPGDAAAQPQHAALVGADDHRPRHADAGQLHHVLHRSSGLRGRRLTSKQGHGEPNPTWIPTGHDAVRRIAARIDGFPGGGWNDVFNIPMTAHFLGGAPIGDSAAAGVIDPYHRVYGHPGLHVVDGAAVSANLGREPVAHDHRAGRAGDGAVAQQGRRRPPTAARRSLRPAGPGGPTPPGRPRRGPGRTAPVAARWSA